MTPENALGAAIEKRLHLRRPANAPVKIYVEWDLEPGWRLLRNLNAVRFELEDIFEQPVALCESGPGCFYARYEVGAIEDQASFDSNESGVDWKQITADDAVRDNLSEMRDRFGISRLQIAIGKSKVTIF